MGSAGQTVSPQTLEAIKQQPWYFGHITRADCDNILTDKGQDGDFMVRESETNVSFQANTKLEYFLKKIGYECNSSKSLDEILYTLGW